MASAWLERFTLVLALTGMFLDMAPAILLLTPVLMPLATALDMDPIHLGILMVCVLTLGLYTPPQGCMSSCRRMLDSSMLPSLSCQ